MRIKGKSFFLCLLLTQISYSLEKIFPRQNIVKKVHDDIKMWCTSNSSELLSFYYAGKEFPKENIRVVNETTIELNLIDVSPMEMLVTCKFNGTKGVDVRRIIVGTPPARINDLQCLSYDFDYFECRFTMPHNYDTVNYHLKYSVGSSPYDCPNETMKDNEFICNITMDSGRYRQVHDDYTFRINATNRLGQNVFEYHVKHFENVIPGKPMLKFKNIGPHSALMEWDVKKTLYNNTGLVYEINILSQYNLAKWEKLDASKIRYISDTKYNYELSDLYAYTWYEVQLRLKVKNATDIAKMWSQTNATFITETKKPDDPPTIDVGSFQPQSTYNNTATEFIIYWKGVPGYKKNAGNLHYIIKEAKKNGEIVNIEPIEPPTLYSAKFVQKEKADYEFTIYTANERGISDVGAVITVPKREFPLPQLTKIYREKSYILTWDQLEIYGDLQVKDYTIFSCISASETSDQCESDFDFIHVGRKVRNFTYPTKKMEKVNFAIAANYYGGGSSGMVWAMCTASENFGTVKPKGLPQNGTTIRLDWSLDCVYSTIVEGFRFNYCPISVNNASCKEPMKTLNISGSLREYYLGNLKPYTTYGIWMSMFSAEKQGPESSTPLEITTLEAAPTPPQGLKVLNVTAHTLGIQWEQPKFHNGKLSGYNIYYNNERKEINDRNDESIITFNLENLSSYKEYKIYVTANTTLESAPSNDISVRTAVDTPSTTEHVNLTTNKDKSAMIISWKRPQVPSGPVDFYEFKVSIFENGYTLARISRINGTKCTISHSQDKICQIDWERIEFNIRAVNLVPIESGTILDSFSEEYYPISGLSQFRCEEESVHFTHWYHDNENKVKFLRGAWSTPYVNRCLFMSNGSPIFLIIFSIALFGVVVVAIYFSSKKFYRMKDIGIEFPPGLTDLDQESGPKGCDNVISREDIRNSDESLCKNENHKLLDTNRVDSGYMNGLDCTEKSVTGEFDDSSMEAIRGEEDSSSSRHAESVEMSDMSDSLSNSPAISPNMDTRKLTPMAPIAAPMPQRQLVKKPIIINGYVQHDSFQPFVDQTIPYTSLDSVENTIIPTNLSTATDNNDLSKHKDPSSINNGEQGNICGYVTHKQLSEFGHRQQ